MKRIPSAKTKAVTLAKEKAPSKPELAKIYSPYQNSIKPTWTIAGVRGAITALSQGRFSEAARLVDSMLTDSRIRGPLDVRLNALFGAPFELEAAGKTKAQQNASNKIADQILDYWWDIAPESELKELHTWKLMLGIGIAEKVWDFGAQAWLPYVKVWHPQFLSYDFNAHVFLLQSKEGIITIDPKQADPKWVLHWDGESGLRNGLVNSLGPKWLLSECIQNDMARYSERLGMPILKGIVPTQADEANKQAFFNQLRNTASDTIALLPQDEQNKFDLDLLEASGKGYESFVEFKRVLDVDKAIAIQGQNLTTEINGGSLAAANVHQDIALEIKRYDAESLSTHLRDQLLKDLVLVNYSSDPGVVPFPCWKVEPAEDLKALADSMQAGIDVIAKAKATAINIDVNLMADKFSIPVSAIEEAKPEQRATFQLAPTDVAKTVTINEARSASNLGPLLMPDGITPDPDGNLTIDAFTQKKAADAQSAALPSTQPNGSLDGGQAPAGT